jgi:hypothetical protein
MKAKSLLAAAALFAGSICTQNCSATVILPDNINSVSQALDWSERFVGAPLVAPVPELSTWAMMLLGFGGLGFAGYRRARRRPTYFADA